MKPLEILSALPKWANAAPESLLDSPAWAMPCRLGDASATLRAAEVRPGESLDLAVLLDGERHLLSIADSPRFADLHALWATRAEVPEPILLALVEKECGVLLQLVENAVRRQLKVEGLASDGPDERTFFMQVEDVVFGLTRSSVVEAALGQLRFVDTAHQSVREEQLPCETEVASFVLSAADIHADHPCKLAQLAYDLGLPYDQMIIYPTFVHFSHRRGGPQRSRVLYNKSYKGRRISTTSR